MGGAGEMELSVTCSTAGCSCQNFSYRVGEVRAVSRGVAVIEFALVVVQASW